MESLSDVLAHHSLFERLRLDELERVARRFTVERLAVGAPLVLVAAAGAPRMLIVISGGCVCHVQVNELARWRGSSLGDSFGELSLMSGLSREAQLEAIDASVVALLGRAELDKLLVEYPAIALPLAAELCQELGIKNDALRQLVELHAERLPKEELSEAIADRQEELARRGARVTRLTPRALFDKLVVQEGAEPPFWILTGFIVALGGARLVVHLILKYHLEQQLFALVPGTEPNPMHVHHFNYGLVLIGISGLAALIPLARRVLRGLSLAFGMGCGLVFDEFSLIWNLNPEYANPSSLIACGTAVAALVQLTYFRGFWRALLRRAYLNLRAQ